MYAFDIRKDVPFGGLPMTSWKSVLAEKLGKALDVYIVRRGSARVLVEREVLAEFLREFEVDCVFDVGANEGQYATRLRDIGYRGIIISVEPIPRLAQQLRNASKGDERWFVEESALAEVESNESFNVMANDRFSSLKSPSHQETTLFTKMNAVVETVVVRTVRLDSLYDRYLSKLSFRRPFLKMDTQGTDLAVARSAGDRLSNFVGLQSELAIKCLYEQQSDYRESIDFYEAAGFVLSSFVPNNAGHFPDLIEMDCIMYNPSRTGRIVTARVSSRTHQSIICNRQETSVDR